MSFEIDRKRIDKISIETIIEELRRVAEHFGFREFSGREFDTVATKCKKTTVLNNFNSWDEALKATGIDLKPHRNPRKDQIPEEELFAELERIWKLLGHRPSRTEWEVSNPRYSYTTYKYRFGGWINACAKFIEFKSGGGLLEEDVEPPEPEIQPTGFSIEILQSRKRHIQLGLRLDVLKRDNFRCVYCGRSPAIEVGVVLHIDHIIPFSQGGETTIENLQTLCEDCNLGKSNKVPNHSFRRCTYGGR